MSVSLGWLLTGHFPWDLVVTGADCASSDTLGSHPEFSDLGQRDPQRLCFSSSHLPSRPIPNRRLTSHRADTSETPVAVRLSCLTRVRPIPSAWLPHSLPREQTAPSALKTFPTLHTLGPGPHSKVLLQHASLTAPPPPLHLLGVGPGWTLHPALPACLHSQLHLSRLL